MGSRCGHCNSFNHSTLIIVKSSTVREDDVVVHKTYCFDLDLSLMSCKISNNKIISTLYNGCSTKHWGFDSVVVTVIVPIG